LLGAVPHGSRFAGFLHEFDGHQSTGHTRHAQTEHEQVKIVPFLFLLLGSDRCRVERWLAARRPSPCFR
jgi:hypothetical protein